MSLYENNVFCLLDLPGDTNLKDIQIALKNLEHRAEFGRTLDYEHVPFFIKNSLSNALKLSNRPEIEGKGYPLRLYRQISEIIFKPVERLRERAFWFDSFQGRFLPDLKALALKDATVPLSNWQGLLPKESTQPFSSPAAVAAAHNLAVYLHAFCLLCDPKAKKEKEWQRALTLWKGCIENETFWERLYGIEAGCSGETAGAQDIINLRKNIAGILLQQNADLAKKALQEGDYYTAFRHYEIIEASGFPPGEIDQQSTQIIDFLIEKIALDCKVTREELEELSGETAAEEYRQPSLFELTKEELFDKKCQQIYHRFSLYAVSAVKFLEKCLPEDDDRTLSARQDLSLCLKEISIALNNRVNNYSKATEIITEAVELAQGTGVWHKLGNDFKIMLSNLCYNVAEELDEAVDDAENAVAARNACTTAFGRYLKEIFPAYDKFVKLWREDECIINDIKEALVECLRSIYWHYYNDTRDYGQAERVLLRAKEIAGNSPASLIIEEDGPVIIESANKTRQQQNLSFGESDGFKKYYKTGKVVSVAAVLIAVILVLIIFNSTSPDDSSSNLYQNKSYTSPGSPSELSKLRAEIEEDKKKITGLKIQIEEIEEQLQLLEMTVKRASSQFEYDRLYSDYENLYNEYTMLYDEYETLINNVNKKATLYNSKIKK
ncbi:MAG: hypothetical protein C4589_01030 [Peptococcaceae bacterium]|nr:MAG: hypothetical protein C4589_01030 [Peptococcaceae bacterium]